MLFRVNTSIINVNIFLFFILHRSNRYSKPHWNRHIQVKIALFRIKIHSTSHQMPLQVTFNCAYCVSMPKKSSLKICVEFIRLNYTYTIWKLLEVYSHDNNVSNHQSINFFIFFLEKNRSLVQNIKANRICNISILSMLLLDRWRLKKMATDDRFDNFFRCCLFFTWSHYLVESFISTCHMVDKYDNEQI